MKTEIGRTVQKAEEKIAVVQFHNKWFMEFKTKITKTPDNIDWKQVTFSSAPKRPELIIKQKFF